MTYGWSAGRGQVAAGLLAVLLALPGFWGCQSKTKMLAFYDSPSVSAGEAEQPGSGSRAAGGSAKAEGSGEASTVGAVIDYKGSQRCAPKRWFQTGKWWCTLCNDTGKDYANNGSSIDDGNACTEDRCDPEKGIVHLPVESQCRQPGLCGVGRCVEGKCVQDPLVCDDKNVCTNDGCLTSGHCFHEAVDKPCDDGNPLTMDDLCIDGTCVGLKDPDTDGILNVGYPERCRGGNRADCLDNCPMEANADQKDSDGDGLGDVCENVLRIYKFDTKEKVVALTFDDGFNDAAVKETLDELKKVNAKATFFLNAMYLDNGTLSRETIEQMRQDGHIIANHSHSHTLGTCEQTAKEALENGDNSLDTLFKGWMMKPHFRSPAFADFPWLKDTLSKSGYAYDYRASLDPKDWREAPDKADLLAKCISETAAPGDIILLHAGPETTTLLLPKMLADMKAKGYQFLTVEEMVHFGAPVPFDTQLSKLCDDYIPQ